MSVLERNYSRRQVLGYGVVTIKELLIHSKPIEDLTAAIVFGTQGAIAGHLIEQVITGGDGKGPGPLIGGVLGLIVADKRKELRETILKIIP